ncbi:MAG: acyl-CoA-binding protein [Bacteroidota bacterium]
MTLQEQFDQAVQEITTITRRPSKEELLTLYGYFKQATEGDVTTPRPKGFDFKELAKHDAWTERKGMSKEDAMNAYISEVGRLVNHYR